MVSYSSGKRGHPPNMRIYASVPLLFTLFGMCAAPSVLFGQTNTPPSPEITVRITAPESTVTAGASIHVGVRVSNIGDAPTLVANRVSMASGGPAFLEFKLTDAQGRVSPALQMIADYPPTIPSDENAAAKLLSSWTLLYPQTSLLFDISIDQSLYKFLGKPGKYRLSATYASASATTSSVLCPIHVGAAKSRQTRFL